MKKKQIKTKPNKSLIREFWNEFVSNYKIDIILAFILLVVVAATASIYPYLIQLVFDGLLEDNSNWIIFPFIIACCCCYCFNLSLLNTNGFRWITRR